MFRFPLSEKKKCAIFSGVYKYNMLCLHLKVTLTSKLALIMTSLNTFQSDIGSLQNGCHGED